MPTSTSQPQPSKKVKSDAQIKGDVLSELKYEPAIKATDFGVVVKDGTVTISGSANNHGDKWHAMRATRRVAGVKAIIDSIDVVLAEPHRRSDADIATAAAHQIEWSTTIPKGTTKVSVHDGWITLDGEVEWWYQKIAAEDVMQYMTGVKGIKNQIMVRPLIVAANVEQDIRAAFARHAMLDAKKIEVQTHGSKVTLTGIVASSTERDEAERVAWAAPGTLSVDNQIKLEWWGLFN